MLHLIGYSCPMNYPLYVIIEPDGFTFCLRGSVFPFCKFLCCFLLSCKVDNASELWCITSEWYSLLFPCYSAVIEVVLWSTGVSASCLLWSMSDQFMRSMNNTSRPVAHKLDPDPRPKIACNEAIFLIIQCPGDACYLSCDSVVRICDALLCSWFSGFLF